MRCLNCGCPLDDAVAYLRRCPNCRSAVGDLGARWLASGGRGGVCVPDLAAPGAVPRGPQPDGESLLSIVLRELAD